MIDLEADLMAKYGQRVKVVNELELQQQDGKRRIMSNPRAMVCGGVVETSGINCYLFISSVKTDLEGRQTIEGMLGPISEVRQEGEVYVVANAEYQFHSRELRLNEKELNDAKTALRAGMR